MKTIVNRTLRAKYEVLDSWEAGLVLSGAEVKSVKKGVVNLTGAYVSLEQGELWLKNAHVSAYQQTNQKGYEAERTRKILLTRREIAALVGKLQEKGLTIAPEKVYSKNGIIKISICLVRGLKKHDKREKIKKREADRKMARALKYNN